MARRDIVVIGASSGGLETLRTVLSALPWDFQAAVFVVLHITEESPGLLPEILNRISKLPVLYAVHQAPILPGRTYLAPEGQRHLTLDRGKVLLEHGPRENRSRPSIDALFRTASYAYGSRVIGVVLTGNLDDGSAGLADIKKRGGTAIVQNPDDAFARSMPASAFESTEVDFVLLASEIGPRLTLVEESIVEKPELVTESRTIKPTGQTYSCP